MDLPHIDLSPIAPPDRVITDVLIVIALEDPTNPDTPPAYRVAHPATSHHAAMGLALIAMDALDEFEIT